MALQQPSISESVSSVSTGRPLDIIFDDGDNELNFDDEISSEQCTLIKSVSVLLKLLKAYGLYFEPDSNDLHANGEMQRRRRRHSRDANTDTANQVVSGMSNVTADENTTNKHVGFNKSKIYCLGVLVLLWANVVRFVTAFDIGERFDDELLMKLSYSFFMLLCALNQTSHYIACRSGHLFHILLRLRITDELAKRVRRKVAFDTVIGGVFYALNTVFFLYAFFDFDESIENFFLCPFNTLVAIPNFTVSIIVRLLAFTITLFLLSAWILPQKLNNVLTFVLHSQFQTLRERFDKDIDANGKFSGSIRRYRRRHQLLCSYVKKVDRFIKVSNSAGFGCHSAGIISNLYLLVFFPMSDLTRRLTFIYWMFCTLFGLFLVVVNGIAINEALLMFQKRLFGEPVGFSVLGIFVISKNTILSILSVLIAYFLMAVRLRRLFSQDTSCTVAVPLNETCY